MENTLTPSVPIFADWLNLHHEAATDLVAVKTRHLSVHEFCSRAIARAAQFKAIQRQANDLGLTLPSPAGTEEILRASNGSH